MYARDHAVIATPIDPLWLEGNDGALVSVRIGEGAHSPANAAAIRDAAAQLAGWPAGEGQDFDLPLEPMPTSRGTAPRHRVVADGDRIRKYSGRAGPKTKSWLLEHERRLSGRTLL